MAKNLKYNKELSKKVCDMIAKKDEYWNYYMEHKNWWAQGVTLKRLKKIKPALMGAKLWEDLFSRHSSLLEMTPEEAMEKIPETFDHAFSNFAANISIGVRLYFHLNKYLR